jgi:hypothetical protein
MVLLIFILKALKKEWVRVPVLADEFGISMEESAKIK